MNRRSIRALKAATMLIVPLTLLAADAPQAAESVDGGSTTSRPRPPSSRTGTSAREAPAREAADSIDTTSDVLASASIAPKSLCEEIRRTYQQKQEEIAKLEADRKQLQKDREDLAKQKEELEKLSQSITQAREELKKETSHLEQLVMAPNGVESGEAADIAATPLSPQAIDTVAKRMRTMKPENAAAVIKRLDPGLASMILMKMKPADSGAIIGKLDADLAAELITLAATAEVAAP